MICIFWIVTKVFLYVMFVFYRYFALYKGLVPKVMRLGPGNKKDLYNDMKIILRTCFLCIMNSISMDRASHNIVLNVNFV